ncbi:MAG: DUF4982 domain-containing protein [Lachnospiraceae bacterium]|nr:DUF4982 domain-containing protein [Lachnospiraceae bacterium]
MFSKKLFNDGWQFAKAAPGTDFDTAHALDYKKINIPHDWLIYQGLDLYEDSACFYKKTFEMKKRPGRRYELYFEGVYMDVTVRVNGEFAGEWKYGYSSFFFDVTELLKDGENEVLVRVNFLSPNSRWYSGAGIYRDVYLIENCNTHIVTDSLYVSAKPVLKEGEKPGSDDCSFDKWEVKVSAEVKNPILRSKITLWFPKAGKSHSALIGAVSAEKISEDVTRVEFTESFEDVKLWSLEEPNLYDAVICVTNPDEDYSRESKFLAPGGPVGDRLETNFGFRDFTLDNNHGLFVNGKKVKINGVCEHHDLGALGAAFNKEAMRRKYEILGQMGVNAIRTAHNMPAPGLLDLADEMGFLVFDESFDMWEGKKTEYDYARFFNKWHETDVRSWIRRDRNHPSILLWSIGNEIYDTHTERGLEVTKMLKKEVRENDFFENAYISIGSNYMPWEGAQKCADVLKVAGYNYAEKLYDEHHAAHPDWFIFGSETSSTVQSRGIYHFPYEKSTLADDNEQCSSLGNSTTSWGAPNPEYCIKAERDHEFSLGQFLWSGFDYIGEPTPYHTRNSYFGQIDTAGFPKDSFYIYKSAWTDYKKEPFVHVFPYWDFNPGQTIDVRIASNAPEVELFVNGKSQGKQKIDHAKGDVLTGNYKVVYEPGEIVAVCYDEKGEEIARSVRKSFGDSASLKLDVYKPERKLYAGCSDLAFVYVSALDGDGNPVENACDMVNVKVSGAGYLTGLDNGDSTDTDEYKGNKKRLFSGKMLIIVAVSDQKGEISVEVSAEGLKGDKVVIPVEGFKKTEGISLLPEVFEDCENKKGEPLKRIRKVELSSELKGRFDAENKETVISAVIFPEKLRNEYNDSDIIWKVVNDGGIDSNIAKIEPLPGFKAKVTAIGDGPFRVRCLAKCGCESAKIISELDFVSEGIGMANINPYEFVTGGLFSYSEGEIGIGNEKGVSSARGERSVIGFENLDFGSYGSDEITIPIFNLSSDEFSFNLWEGIPGKEGSSLVLAGKYHKEMIWNVYQEETYKLSKRLKGITSLYIEAWDKVHFKGFTFKKLQKAFEEICAGECDSVYGDKFTKTSDGIEGIGNNVTVEFEDMDFGEEKAEVISLTGKTDIDICTVHLIFDRSGEQIRDILEFKKDAGKTQRFEIKPLSGKGTVKFIFLPGSSFDFESFRFEK